MRHNLRNWNTRFKKCPVDKLTEWIFGSDGLVSDKRFTLTDFVNSWNSEFILFAFFQAKYFTFWRSAELADRSPLSRRLVFFLNHVMTDRLSTALLYMHKEDQWIRNTTVKTVTFNQYSIINIHIIIHVIAFDNKLVWAMGIIVSDTREAFQDDDIINRPYRICFNLWNLCCVEKYSIKPATSITDGIGS